MYWEGDSGQARQEATARARLKVRRAGAGRGHGKGWAKRRGERGSQHLRAREGRARWGHRYTTSHCLRVLKQNKNPPYNSRVPFSHRYSEETSGTTNTVAF